MGVITTHAPSGPLVMIWGLQTQSKSWPTGRAFWVNCYLKIVISKFSGVNRTRPDPVQNLRGSVISMGDTSGEDINQLSWNIPPQANIFEIFWFNRKKGNSGTKLLYFTIKLINDHISIFPSGDASGEDINQLSWNSPQLAIIFENFWKFYGLIGKKGSFWAKLIYFTINRIDHISIFPWGCKILQRGCNFLRRYKLLSGECPRWIRLWKMLEIWSLTSKSDLVMLKQCITRTIRLKGGGSIP